MDLLWNEELVGLLHKCALPVQSETANEYKSGWQEKEKTKELINATIKLTRILRRNSHSNCSNLSTNTRIEWMTPHLLLETGASIKYSNISLNSI